MRVYHLLPARWAINDLARRRLKVAQFADLNDPFELLSLELSRPAQRKAFAKWRADSLARYGVLCFSRSWRSPVLWSHYADKHKGICLGFDVPNSWLKPVIWVKERLPLPKAFLENGAPDASVLDQLFRTKFDHWRYEEESRVVVPLQQAHKEGRHFFRPFGADLVLKELVAGPRCTAAQATLGAAVADISAGVTVSKARLAFKRFAVVTNKQGFGKQSMSPNKG